MSISLPIRDEPTPGKRENALTLDFLNERITVRELIRERVYEEVRQHNAGLPSAPRFLVRPTETEALLNGERAGSRLVRQVDWQTHYDRALAGFEARRFFILVDDRQMESLDEEIALIPTTDVRFLRLVPLVGG